MDDREVLVNRMIAKGYVVQKADGKFSPSDAPPPEDEPDEELVEFWRFLTEDKKKRA